MIKLLGIALLLIGNYSYRKGTCQWPTGKGPCGKVTENGKRYCHKHLHES